MSEYVVAIDFGTQSVRAIAFDSCGAQLAAAATPLAPYSEPKSGWVEQEPDYFWRALCQTTQELMQQPGVSATKMKAIALTTQRATVINLDEKGQPLRPAMIWMDQRVSETLPPMPWYWSAAFALSGQRETVRYLRRQCEINWISEHQPEIWRKTAHYLFLSGYLNFRLTGDYVDSAANQVGYVPFDFKAQRWAGKTSWKWHAVNARAETLPDLVPVGQPLGTLSPEAASETGLPAGTTLIASAGDKACEVLGSGCLEPDVACLSFGTQATVSTMSPRYIEPIRMLPAFPAPLPGHYCTEVTVVRGFWMVTWFKEQFAALESLTARDSGRQPEALLDEMIRDIEPGSKGLILQPFWGGGIRYPGLSAKGAVIGFGGVHTKAHLYRAILEGLAYALRDGRERIEKRSGVPVRSLRISGGGSQSDVAMQIAADVFGLPAERPASSETSAIGAAINAAVASGLHSDYPSAVAAMTRMGQRFEPDPRAREIYDRLYRQVYCKMYGQLESMYRDIREITGYPT
jgi:sugar (pentulose or hexulose) kinase